MDTIVTPASIKQLARLEELLRRAGIGRDQIQLLIDDTARRNLVAQVWLHGDNIPVTVLPSHFNEDAMRRFVEHVFGKQISRVKYLSEQPGYQLVSDGYDVSTLAQEEVIKDLLKGLDNGHTTVAIMRSGLVDGKESSATEVARHLGTSIKNVSAMRSAVTDHVRARQRQLYPLMQYERAEDAGNTPIGKLNLSTRTYSMLMQHDIRQVEKLIGMTESELRGIRHFNNSTVGEISTALRRHGLALRKEQA